MKRKRFKHGTLPILLCNALCLCATRQWIWLKFATSIIVPVCWPLLGSLMPTYFITGNGAVHALMRNLHLRSAVKSLSGGFYLNKSAHARSVWYTSRGTNGRITRMNRRRFLASLLTMSSSAAALPAAAQIMPEQGIPLPFFWVKSRKNREGGLRARAAGVPVRCARANGI